MPQKSSRVARSPAPHYPQTTSDQAHTRLTLAITAPQTPRLRPPAAGDGAALPLTGTRRAALLGTCARARATRRHAPSVDSAYCRLTFARQSYLGTTTFFFRVMITVLGLTPSTRAVSRMPLPFSAISTIRCLTA